MSRQMSLMPWLYPFLASKLAAKACIHTIPYGIKPERKKNQENMEM
ncbi:MAG: hypothetical protein J6X27_04105 [Bacteroidaceae bacterium]|nr:hypothetical protein [Bacteroidaceae bacterium]